jgi:hypothetical protein
MRRQTIAPVNTDPLFYMNPNSGAIKPINARVGGSHIDTSGPASRPRTVTTDQIGSVTGRQLANAKAARSVIQPAPVRENLFPTSTSPTITFVRNLLPQSQEPPPGFRSNVPQPMPTFIPGVPQQQHLVSDENAAQRRDISAQYDPTQVWMYSYHTCTFVCAADSITPELRRSVGDKHS